MDSAVLKADVERLKDEMNNENVTLDEDDLGSCAAPKVLGDVFESIVGAIFVEAGLKKAWKVAIKLLKGALEAWAVPGKIKEHRT